MMNIPALPAPHAVNVLTITANPALDVSAVTPQIRPTSKLRCEQVQRHPGGGGINVARMLHRLGVECCAVYPQGGTTGALLTTLLAADGVRAQTVAIAGLTRESFTVQDASTAQEYRFVLPGPQLSPSEVDALLQQLQSALTQSVVAPRWLVASGSLPPGAPPTFYATLARMAKQFGARLVVDSSGPALKAAMDEGVYLVKPSIRELREIAGQALTTIQQVADVAAVLVKDKKAQVVVVSLGDEGALMVSADGCWYAAALQVPVVSAVGAGDSFVAGMVAALARSEPLLDSFKWGVACASASLATAGTGLCDVADVRRLYRSVTLTDGQLDREIAHP